MRHINDHLFLIVTALTAALGLATVEASGQSDTLLTESIAVSARPTRDSIVLRWAPLDLTAWQLGNESGYRIERYTLARNGIVLSAPTLTIVQHAMRPLPESEWEDLVTHDRYAAIAAQALFGDRFEVDLRQSDIFSIVNKVQENEQRFAFALFSADMSAKVARASGLWFTDHDVRENEKYLYRIVLNASDKLRGSIFVSPADPYELPKPLNLSAAFKDKIVALKWEKTRLIQYTAYVLERSEDGRNFTRVSDTPLITLSPNAMNDTRYEYAMDSLQDISRRYYYRVRGITPFGETGPPSDPVKGQAVPAVSQVPYIRSAISADNTTVDLQWDFHSTNDEAIKGFDIERASAPKGEFKSLTNVLLSPQRRSFTDINPNQSNYYKVIAYGKDGELYPSHVYFANLVDSIPPSAPAGLEAKVNDDGEITLTWHSNPEADVYGYRVYKAYHVSEELAQLTTEPVKQTAITDHIDLNTLNEHLYYSVMTIDRSQNHSSLSSLLKVSLPDKVKPQPPVMLPPKSDASGILISWRQGGSGDVVQYNVYRRSQREQDWQRVFTAAADGDSVFSYKDVVANAGIRNFYTITSIDDAGLESEAASPVAGTIPINALKKALEWEKPRINREENVLSLSWNSSEEEIDVLRIFRSVGNEPMTIYRTINGDRDQFADVIIPGRTYRYRILALFTNGQRSALSQELQVDY